MRKCVLALLVCLAAPGLASAELHGDVSYNVGELGFSFWQDVRLVGTDGVSFGGYQTVTRALVVPIFANFRFAVGPRVALALDTAAMFSFEDYDPGRDSGYSGVFLHEAVALEWFPFSTLSGPYVGVLASARASAGWLQFDPAVMGFAGYDLGVIMPTGGVAVGIEAGWLISLNSHLFLDLSIAAEQTVWQMPADGHAQWFGIDNFFGGQPIDFYPMLGIGYQW